MGPVLIATDGSDQAIAAAGLAASLLAPELEFVIVSTVAEPDLMELQGGGFAGPAASADELAEEHAEARSGAELDTETTAAALGHRVAAARKVVGGEAGPALVRLAGELGASAIVVGSHGKGLFARLFEGSVSRYLLDHAPCPVLVVPGSDS